MNWPAVFEQTAQDMATHAMRKGWWQWARYEVQQMEAQEHGCWVGLKARVAEIIKAAGFKPHPGDQASLKPSKKAEEA